MTPATLRAARLPLLFALLLIATNAFSCKTVPHAIDEVKSVHFITEKGIEHRFEIEHYSWLSGQMLFGFLKRIPGLGGSAQRETEIIEDPAGFCSSNVKIFRNVNLDYIPEAAEVVHWAGRIAEIDPFPLSRAEGVRVLRRVVEKYQPSLDLLDIKDSDYVAGAVMRLDRIKKLQSISFGGELTDELRAEFIKTIIELEQIPYTRSGAPREIAVAFALNWIAETDKTIREALWRAAQLLMVRGALLSMDSALDDSHEQVRVTAAREFVAALGPEALPRLIKKLQKDTSPAVRAAVAAIVGDAARIDHISNEPLIEYLAAAVRDPEPAVSVNAMEALGRVSGVGRHYDTEWWRRWYEKRLLERPKN
ncbi:MAG: HEAT repeat domain-containing protein [Planctomycetota bacterium]